MWVGVGRIHEDEVHRGVVEREVPRVPLLHALVLGLEVEAA